MFDKESFKKYISAGSSNPIYYFKRRRSSYELPSLHWGRKVRPGVPNRVDVGSYPQHLSLHRTYGSRIRRYIHIGERKL